MKKSPAISLALLTLFFVQQANAQTNFYPINGNIGFGTSNPAAKLEVHNGTQLATTLGSVNNIAALSGLSGNYSQLKFQLVRHTEGAGWSFAATRIQAATDISNQAYIDFNPRGNEWGMALGLAGGNPIVNIMGITGNVGIGTNTPSSCFEVHRAAQLGNTAGNSIELAKFSGFNSNYSQLKLQLIRHTSGDSWTNAATRIQAVTDVTNQAYIDFNPQGGMAGMALGINGNVPVLSIANNGTVRIGNVNYNSSYKLFVEQGILTEKVKVAVANSTNWADYVFSPDYQLKNLTEVEQFIKANKHLPNIPGADEMVKEGNDLGKTDAKLLEKIEELTLYLIEMKKEIKTQNQKIERLESQLKNQKSEL